MQQGVEYNKLCTLWVYEKLTNGFYVTSTSMNDLQKHLDLPNLCYSVKKINKSYCKKKHPTKYEVKNVKKKWDNVLVIIKVCTFLEF